MEGFKITTLSAVLFVTLAALNPTILGHIGEFDEVWQKRAAQAWEHALRTYEPDPTNVTDALNHKVHRYIYIYIYVKCFIVNIFL